MLTLDVVLISVTFLVVVLGAVTIALLNYSSRKKENEAQMFKIYVDSIDSKSIEDIQDLLNKIMDECMNDYMATHPEIAQQHYITEEEETQIRKDLSSLLINRMSVPFLNKLSLYYNSMTISSIIAEKIYIKVTGYVVENNVSLNTNE